MPVVAVFHLREVLILFFLCFTSSTTMSRDGSCRRGVSGASPVLHSTTTITATGECLVIGKKSLLYIAITTALTCVVPLTSDAKYVNDSPLQSMKTASGTTENAVGVFSPGYKIDAEQYRYLVDPFTKLMTVQAAIDADSTTNSLRNDANVCITEGTKLWALDANKRMEEKKVPSFLFMGHSRGGAVAALAAAILLNSTTHSNIINKAVGDTNIAQSFPLKALLVLLDPVDSSEGFVLDELKKTLRIRDSNKSGPSADVRTSKVPGISDSGSQSSLAEQGALSEGWPWPVLIVSTPFGGQSKYYKVPYESSCSPVHRNGDAFARVLRGHSATSSVDVLHSSDGVGSKDEGSHVVHVRLPDVGHTQLLQNRKKSTVGSVCVANEKISDEDVKGLISALTQSWVNIFGSGRNEPESESDDITAKVEELKETITTMYPAIRTEWSF